MYTIYSTKVSVHLDHFEAPALEGADGGPFRRLAYHSRFIQEKHVAACGPRAREVQGVGVR